MNRQKVKEEIASNLGIMLVHILGLVDNTSEESFEEIFDDVETLNDGEIARGILNLWFRVCTKKEKGDPLNQAVYAALEKFQKQYIDEGEPANDEQRVD